MESRPYQLTYKEREIPHVHVAVWRIRDGEHEGYTLFTIIGHEEFRLWSRQSKIHQFRSDKVIYSLVSSDVEQTFTRAEMRSVAVSHYTRDFRMVRVPYP